jgi:hypothetical protein
MCDLDVRGTIRLAALLACVALATSRLGLVAHELVGHGGAAVAVGAKVTAVQLFDFAGGWIRYELPGGTLAERLLIAMAGIAVELVIAGALVVAVRRGDTLARRIVRGIAAALALHATWYAANGAWSGFGDGVLLYRMLGAARTAFAICVGATSCMAAWWGAREVLAALAQTLRGGSAARVTGVVIAIVFAAGLHAALAIGELALRRDATYATVMQPEAERQVAREMSTWTTAQPTQPSAEQVAAHERVVRAQHASFPFGGALAIACAILGLVGARRSRALADARVSNGLLARAALAAASAIALVIVLDAVLG